jgi:hypothetical protein
LYLSFPKISINFVPNNYAAYIADRFRIFVIVIFINIWESTWRGSRIKKRARKQGKNGRERVQVRRLIVRARKQGKNGRERVQVRRLIVRARRREKKKVRVKI